MKFRFESLKIALKTALREWWTKDPFKESAVIAYYAIFALPGLLVVIVSVAGIFFGKEAVNGQIAGQITSTMGADTAVQIQEIIAKASESKNSVIANILGILTILLGATGVFIQFQKSLNTIWEVKADESKSGIISILKARLFSFGIIVATAFILIVSLVVSATLAAFGTWVIKHFSESFIILLQIVNFIISLSIIALLFALMYKTFPDAKIKWRHVWIGSFLTAILFEIGKFALGFYFGKAEPGSGYGAAGSSVLILLWVSYSSMIVFYGAEFTHAYAELKDGKIAPDENAVKQVAPKV
ncbi:MAG: YihY/virulence factor BrkB family protein [Saprospiraceae bacterium]|nr:YihY/virulence factor BrkB family protein [Saprospiraceae bacterium]